MSEKPRTDALEALIDAGIESNYEMTRLSRKLERELNEANAKLEAEISARNGWWDNYKEEQASHAETLRLAQQLKDELVKAERERDDLRTKLQHANAAALNAINAKVPLIADNARLVAELAELHKQFDALRNSQQQP